MKFISNCSTDTPSTLNRSGATRRGVLRGIGAAGVGLGISGQATAADDLSILETGAEAAQVVLDSDSAQRLETGLRQDGLSPQPNRTLGIEPEAELEDPVLGGNPVVTVVPFLEASPTEDDDSLGDSHLGLLFALTSDRDDGRAVLATMAIRAEVVREWSWWPFPMQRTANVTLYRPGEDGQSIERQSSQVTLSDDRVGQHNPDHCLLCYALTDVLTTVVENQSGTLCSSQCQNSKLCDRACRKFTEIVTKAAKSKTDSLCDGLAFC